MTNSNHSKAGEDSQSRDSHSDEQWQEFLDAHSDDLENVESSRAAKKFERSAQRAEKKAQRKLRIEDFNDSVFAQPRTPIRGYSVSWLDADEADNHFHAPDPSWNSLQIAVIAAVILIILGFASLLGALCVPQLRQFLGATSGILILLGFAIWGSSRSKAK